MSDREANVPIEPISHASEGIDCSIHLDNGGERPVGVCDNFRGSGEGINLVHTGGYGFVGSGWWGLRGINREGIERCIELSRNSIETLIAKIECAITVERKWNFWVPRYSCGCRVWVGDTGRRVNRV